MTMTAEQRAQLRLDIERRKALPPFGPDTSIERLKIINATQRSFTPDVVEALLDELERKDARIQELEANHTKLRDRMAAIHNTIRLDGSGTSLSGLLSASKRAWEESAPDAGINLTVESEGNGRY